MHIPLVLATALITKIGAVSFGAVVGWCLYYVNRWRKNVVVGDLAAVVGAIGGAAILKLFPATGETFGYYGLGLGIGFFLYFVLLTVFAFVGGDGAKYFTDPPPDQHPLLAEGDNTPP